MTTSVNGFTAGAWDLLHPGHMAFLSDAYQQCDHLYVGLHVNPNVERSIKDSPVQTLVERWLQLHYLGWRELTICPYETEDDLLTLLKTLPIHKRFLGSDYLGADFTGKDYGAEADIATIYLHRDHDFSSTELRDRLKK